MNVQNVRVAYIRPQGYQNLKKWIDNENNLYIGRGGIVFIDEERYPKVSSKWHNPFKVGTQYTRDSCLEAYEIYIKKKIKKYPKKYNLKELVGKTLGCWCFPKKCHGNVLIKLLKQI